MVGGEFAPGHRFAGFTIERCLKFSPHSAVYVARHPRLPKRLVLKVLQSIPTSADRIAAFDAEAGRAAHLDHPHIVSILDIGRDADRSWIATQYIDAVDAAQAIDTARIAPARAAHIVSDIASALDYAHTQGVLHGHVKASNILLETPRPGRRERVLLTDFGFTAATHDPRRDHSPTAALPCAPEQIVGSPPGPWSDVYALGCTAYQLLTGEAPYSGAIPVVLRAHLDAPIPRPSRIQKDLPPAVDAVIATALAKRPQDRYRTCTELAQALQRALHERSGLTRRTRHKVWGAAIAVLVLGATAAAAVWIDVRGADSPGEYKSPVPLAFTGLDDPAGIAVDTEGTVYVADGENNRILSLRDDAASQDVLPFDNVASPGGVDVGADGEVTVASFGTGDLIRLDQRTGTETVLTDQFTHVFDVASSPVDNSVFVTDAGRLYRLAPVTSRGTITEISIPDGQANWLAVAPDGTVVVTDRAAGRIGRVDPDSGRYEPIAVDGLRQPGGVAVDSDGRIFIVDGNSVVRVASDGTDAAVLAFGDVGTLIDVAVTAEGGIVVTTDEDRVLELPRS
ncbi:serine/threonine-protein kinase [Antrihabitans sp. YC2-6]|uniref:serine/threonine-protein kinase n=1 Tax=Antrihabitans sp. YC2-6 TaxID=2799498 RepID=UPI0018F6E065|nr:serine/threonine-protein kinase [Antrihabitans sp. YC2-6]MBJ8347083.1 protein kinase [Antrihabitans sp. YC2-6]